MYKTQPKTAPKPTLKVDTNQYPKKSKMKFSPYAKRENHAAKSLNSSTRNILSHTTMVKYSISSKNVNKDKLTLPI